MVHLLSRCDPPVGIPKDNREDQEAWETGILACLASWGAACCAPTMSRGERTERGHDESCPYKLGMLDVGDFAGGRGVGDFGGGVEEGTFQASVAVDVGGNFHPFGESDVFAVQDGNDGACRGTGALAFAAGAQDSLIIVGEADAANEDAEFAAAA